jgi:hypothetical protein
MTRKPDGTPSPREAGLRRLAADSRDRVEHNLRLALSSHRASATGKKLLALIALGNGVAEAMPSDAATDQRVTALWRLIRDQVDQVELTDERTALTAALHLDPSNRGSSIDTRLVFARDRGDFGLKSSGARHGYDALRRWWGDGVRLLSRAVDERLSYLSAHPEGWHEYLDAPAYRRPSRGAQPVFMELFVTTVIMKGRGVERRITERLVTAREDNVRYFIARALPEMDDLAASVPVRALWGCKAERMPSRPGDPVLTRLVFPVPLQRGQRHFFSSEAVAGKRVRADRRAINVEVDHHGIAPGQRLHNVVPVAGLTVRVRFDVDELPEGVWWYADVTERERYTRPEPGDERWVSVSSQGYAEHTFTDPCQPLAHYGVSIAWPVP